MRQRGARITIAGTHGSGLLDELDARPSDRVLVKKRYSAFFGTTLEQDLADRGITRLIVAGVNTHACVRMTVIDAYQRDLEVVISIECVAGRDHRHHEVTLEYLNNEIATVVPLSEVIA